MSQRPPITIWLSLDWQPDPEAGDAPDTLGPSDADWAANQWALLLRRVEGPDAEEDLELDRLTDAAWFREEASNVGLECLIWGDDLTKVPRITTAQLIKVTGHMFAEGSVSWDNDDYESGFNWDTIEVLSDPKDWEILALKDKLDEAQGLEARRQANEARHQAEQDLHDLAVVVLDAARTWDAASGLDVRCASCDAPIATDATGCECLFSNAVKLRGAASLVSMNLRRALSKIDLPTPLAPLVAPSLPGHVANALVISDDDAVDGLF